MKLDRKTYEINIAGMIRELPIIQISDNLAIASFVLLGDSADEEHPHSGSLRIIGKTKVLTA